MSIGSRLTRLYLAQGCQTHVDIGPSLEECSGRQAALILKKQVRMYYGPGKGVRNSCKCWLLQVLHELMPYDLRVAAC